MSPARAALALVVAAAMACAIIGIGMGDAPAAREPAPSEAQVAAARQRIAAAGASMRRGRELFASEGCDRCHAIAAIGADGLLGPRLDTLEEDGDDNLQSIAEPRGEITDGYPENLMPADFAKRLDRAGLRALADFVTTVSGGEARGGGDGGKGRARGRGRGRGRGRSGGG
jgi:cytochrome c5